MGQIRQVGDVYYIEFYARGLMYSQVAGSNFKEAQALLDATEAKISRGEALTIVRNITLPMFFEQFIKAINPQFSLKTVERFQHTITHFNNFLIKHYPNLTSLAQITPVVIETYKAYLTQAFKPKIINFTILILREIFEYGIKIGFINDNPTLHVRLMELPQRIFPASHRLDLFKDLLQKGVTIGRLSQLIKLTDIARVMYFAPLIPASREDMHLD